MTSLRFHGVRFGYGAGRPVLTRLDLTVGPGLTLLTGANGSGKSTLLRLAAGWIGDPPVLLQDEPLEAMDAPMRARIVEWVGRTLAGGGLALASTHTPGDWAALPHRVLTLSEGKVV